MGNARTLRARVYQSLGTEDAPTLDFCYAEIILYLL